MSQATGTAFGPNVPKNLAEIAQNLAEVARRFAGRDAGRSVRIWPFEPAMAPVGVRDAVSRPAASLMKIPLVLAALEESAPVTDVKVSELYTTRWPSVLAGLDADRYLSVHELAALSLMTSDNDCAQRLWEMVGSTRVQRQLNITGSQDSFAEVGFADANLGRAGRRNLTSARDCLQWFATLNQHPDGSRVRRWLANNLRNHRIPLLLPDDWRVEHKTGSLAGVVNDVGVISNGSCTVGLAFVCDQQVYPAQTNLDIAHASLDACHALSMT